MKKILYISIALLILACANNKSENNLEKFDIPDVVNKVVFSEEEDDSFVYQNLAKQKLQDYFDLLLLQKKHPEFRDNIAQQLQHISKDSIYINENIDSLSIQNLQQLGKSKIISDSVQKMRLVFDLVGRDFIKKDSITAIIKSRKIIFNNEEVLSTSISFSKIK